MTVEGDYVPSPAQWVRDQVEAYERSGGREANTLRDTGLPIVVVTSRGNKTGAIRKTPLMRVEHDGEYALVASKGGAPAHPVWYYNLVAHPDAKVQVKGDVFDVRARTAEGDERRELWDVMLALWPDYDDYQARTDREIPVVVLERR